MYRKNFLNAAASWARKTTACAAFFWLAFLCVSPAALHAAELPGELDDAGKLTVAWQIECLYGGQDGVEARDSLFVYSGLGDTNYRGGQVAPDPPQEEFDGFYIRYGTERFSTVAYSFNASTAFLKTWNLCVRSAEGDCRLKITRLTGALPDGATLILADSTGTVRADWTSVTEESAEPVTLPAGDYVLTAELKESAYDCSLKVALFPGWNLLASPLKRMQSATAAGKELVTELDVYIWDDANCFRKAAKLSELTNGKAFWLYWDGNAQTTLSFTGKCQEGDVSAFPENSSRWRLMGLSGKYDTTEKTICAASQSLPEDAWSWDAGAQGFVRKSGLPELGVGYFLKYPASGH